MKIPKQEKTDEPVFITENGIKLYTKNTMVKILNNEIKRQKLEKTQVFFSVHPNGYESYLLVVNGKPYFESQVAEEIGGQIDMLVIGKRYK